MELTGKCKEDFEKWYFKYQTKYKMTANKKLELDTFNVSKNNMKFGVYVDFFDSKDIVIDLPPIQEPTMGGTKTHGFKVYMRGFKQSHTILTRLTARIKAVEKANEIYNKAK